MSMADSAVGVTVIGQRRSPEAAALSRDEAAYANCAS